MSRRISGLREAQEAKNPWPQPKRQPKGARGMGLSFEKALEKALRKKLLVPERLVRNPWYSFSDSFGKGFCSPDLVLHGDDRIMVFEAKLTRYDEAVAQLRYLYQPILSMVHKKPVHCVVALKYLSPGLEGELLCSSLNQLLAFGPSTFPVLHYLGRGPIS